jgi:hypothetical protein
MVLRYRGAWRPCSIKVWHNRNLLYRQEFLYKLPWPDPVVRCIRKFDKLVPARPELVYVKR